MRTVDVAHLIKDIVVSLRTKRADELPTIRLIISPGLPTFPWRDDSLERLLREIFSEFLRSRCGDLPVQIKVSSRPRLQDLQAFIGLSPLYWIQIKFSGYGLLSMTDPIETKLQQAGYYCEEWIGMDNASSQLAIFCPERGNASKLVLYLNTHRYRWECDFLIPVLENCISDAA